MRSLYSVLGTALAVAGFCSTAHAQDVEPSTCAEAEGVSLTVPSGVIGAIAPEDAQLRTDVDYFRYTAEPGTALTLVAGPNFGGTRVIVAVGVLDEQCNRIASTPEAAIDVLDFQVPASGEFVVAVAERSDREFAGDGGGTTPLYGFSLSEQAPRIGSFSGRLIDGRTGEPMVGRVSLQLCTGAVCSTLNRQPTAADGEFRFDTDVDARQLPAGLLVATFAAPGYDTLTRTLLVREGEAPDLGDVSIQMPEHLE